MNAFVHRVVFTLPAHGVVVACHVCKHILETECATAGENYCSGVMVEGDKMYHGNTSVGLPRGICAALGVDERGKEDG